jgi:hypothetical protein
MRKLILLALGGAAAAYVIKSRGAQAAPSAASAGGGYAPGPESAAEAPVTDEVEPTAADEHAEEVASAEATPEEAAVADTVESDAVVPDTSADDPLVRQQEDAAAADAATIGGEPDTVAADVDPEMRPVIEGSGDDEETFEEEIEDQGR